MSIDELIKKVEIAAKKRTKEERRQLLIDARIFDEDGVYDARYFSEKTVQESKRAKKVS